MLNHCINDNYVYVVCGKLPLLENGRVVYIPGGHSLTHGTLAVHDCDEGFVLNGNPIRMCVAGGSIFQGVWTSHARLCQSEFMYYCDKSLRHKFCFAILACGTLYNTICSNCVVLETDFMVAPIYIGATAGGDDSKITHAVESVQELVKMLSDIGNWEALCTNLGVNRGVMSELIHTSLDANIKKKRCLESYFDSGLAHWEEVIKAVVGPGILNERVAKKITYKYLLDYQDILNKHEL